MHDSTNGLGVVARILRSGPDRDHAPEPAFGDTPAVPGDGCANCPATPVSMIESSFNIFLGVPSPLPHLLTMYNRGWQLSTGAPGGFRFGLRTRVEPPSEG